MFHRLVVLWLLIGALVVTLGFDCVTAQPTVSSTLTLRASGIADQDDMTFWLHPSDLSLSTIIASDKTADKLFVYDLHGNTLQVIAAQKPGNIDTRYGFLLGDEFVDIVAFNERNSSKIRVYKVDPGTRQLIQIDNGTINVGSNYGFTLYKSPFTGDFYAFTGPSSSTRVKQFRLVDAGNGRVAAVGPLRQLQALGTVEGMVADDEQANIYLAEENGGLWKFAAEPDGATTGTKIAAVGQNGLAADVEGVTIYYLPQGQGYLIASSQGNETFKVYQRQPPHSFVGTFAVSGVSNTDGLDVTNLPLPLNGTASQGVFALHNGRASPYAVELVQWEHIASALGLSIDTGYWDPRVLGPVDNTPPMANADTAETDEDTPVVVNVFDNDPADPDGDPLTVVSVTQPGHGSATINADNTVTYAPAANFNGPDSFTYRISDGRGGFATATVDVTVLPWNDPPVASDRAVSTGLNTPVAITLQATDPDNDPLTYWIVDGPTNGFLSGTAPNLTYTPDVGYAGPDSFTFWVDDGATASNLATVSIMVSPPVVLLATDGFESGTYAGGSGWNGPWTKSGEVSIRTNTDGPQEGSRHVRLRSNSGYLKRALNLSGATNVHLTFWSKVRSFENSDKALVRVSADGVNFTTVMTFTAAHSNNTYYYYDIDLSSFGMTSTFTIAFDAEMSSTGDYWYVDNLQVTGVR